jgi:hypothetical protein
MHDKGGTVSILEMLETHPQPVGGELDVRARCVEACNACAALCTSCADADLGERDIGDLIQCIRRCLDCADLCAATARIVIRQTASDVDVVRAAVEACVVACRTAGAECERHAEHHAHCRICAEACRECEEACNGLLAALS